MNLPTYLIKDATVVNEMTTRVCDVLIRRGRIEKIGTNLSDLSAIELSAAGLYLLPGMIDDQVHFRDPGLTYKADLTTESKAAVAGGVTSFMDMHNTLPNTLTQELLEQKYKAAAKQSVANYSFFMGINQDNLDQALRTDNEWVAGVTDDGLYFNDSHGILANYPRFLEQLFSKSDALIALHSEDDQIIAANLKQYQQRFGDEIPPEYHHKIRSEAACLVATERIIGLAQKHGNRLHVYHLSTAAEIDLFDSESPLEQKRITTEACVHHLSFTESDYLTKGHLIKWNPAVKTAHDRLGLIEGLRTNAIDFIATDHATHSFSEKQGNYSNALSGGPLVQHALQAALELYHNGHLSLEKVVQKTSHHVAEAYRMIERGYIREGYHADLVLVDLNSPHKVTSSNLLYKCGWSPFDGHTFSSTIVSTFVGGQKVFDRGEFNTTSRGQRLQFKRDRI